MATLQELLSQKAALEKEIDETRRNERADAIAKVRALMSEHDLSLADLSARSLAKSPAPAKNKVAAKFRNEVTGDSWSGRGLQPKWLRAALASGRKLEDFAI